MIDTLTTGRGSANLARDHPRTDRRTERSTHRRKDEGTDRRTVGSTHPRKDVEQPANPRDPHRHHVELASVVRSPRVHVHQTSQA